MIHSRFAVPVAVLLGCALVPTVIHSYSQLRIDDGLRAAAVADTLASVSSAVTARRPDWVKRNFDTDDWFERSYQTDATTVTLFVARSYDPKRLYHHPELALLRGMVTRSAGVFRTTTRPDIPLHLIETEQGDSSGLAVYALIYDGRFVEDPLPFQIRTSFELLFSGRKPMTILLAAARQDNQSNPEAAAATRLLLEAVRGFERQTLGNAGAATTNAR